MHDIFGYQPTMGELIVAFLLALIAEKFFKVTSRIWAWITDSIAAMSRITRARQILENKLIEFKKQIGDANVRTLTHINEVSRSIIIIVCQYYFYWPEIL